MTRVRKRRLLHALGACLLLSLIPLSISYGAVGAIIVCLLALVCFVAAGLIGRAANPSNHKGSRTPYICPYEVEFDDAEVRVKLNGQLHEKLAWVYLKAVGVKIDESFLPAPWWMLFASPESGCIYPSEAKGGSEMLEEMQRRLPGFDNHSVIEAMGLMEGGRLVWSKDRAEAQPIIPPDAAR